MKKALAEQLDPILFFVERASLPLHEVSSHIVSFSELSQKEQYEHQRVVGGCGLEVENKPLSPGSRGEGWAGDVVHHVEARDDEQFFPLSMVGSGRAEGFGFSLQIVDEPAAQESEYWWMEHLLTSEERQSFSEKKILFEAIAEGNKELFRKALTPELLESKDIHGVSLFHRAAESPNKFFLQRLCGLAGDAHDPERFRFDLDQLTRLYHSSRS